MILLVPLAIFLVLCIVMIIVLSYTPNPTDIETVEALCDAINRNDVKTQKTLMTLDATPLPVIEALDQIRNQHDEVAMAYGATVVENWDDNTASYSLVSIPLISPDESILFKCRNIVNQWTIISISIVSPRKYGKL